MNASITLWIQYAANGREVCEACLRNIQLEDTISDIRQRIVTERLFTFPSSTSQTDLHISIPNKSDTVAQLHFQDNDILVVSILKHDNSASKLPLRKRIEEAATYIKTRTGINDFQVAIVLGTGLGKLVEEQKLEDYQEISCSDIPHFSPPTVSFHTGKLITGSLFGVKVVFQQGRLHYYEGYAMEEVTFAIRVFKGKYPSTLGVHTLVVSNACGGLNKQFEAGDIVLIEDHISFLMGTNPLIGINDETLGPRWPAMKEPYSHRLLKSAENIARREMIKTHRGVYVFVTGPSQTTRSELAFLTNMGADVLGYSTVPEVIVAAHCGITNVLGIGIVTDMCLPYMTEDISVEAIVKVAIDTAPNVYTIMKGVIQQIGETPMSKNV